MGDTSMFQNLELHFLLRQKLCLLLVLVGFGVGPVQAQEVTIRGVVTTSDEGTALQDANVLIQTLDGEQVAATATNVDGLYEFSGLEAGSYVLRVSFVGYETHEHTMELEGGVRRYNVTLAPREQQLQEVQVEAERGAARREAGLQTVGAADIQRIPTPGPGGDLAAYLQTLPGVVSGGDRGGGLSIRGGTSSQNMFRVDDIPIIKPLHISNLYSAFPEAAVKNVDVYAGGFGAEYLGATSSVIDVSLREGNQQRYVGGASISPFIGSARLEGPIEKGRQSFLGILRYSTVKETGGPVYGQEVPLSFYDLTARYSFQGEDRSCSLTAVHTQDEGRLSNERAVELSWSNTALGGRCLLFGSELDEALTVSGGYSQFRNSSGRPGASSRTAGLQLGFLSVERDQDTPFGKLLLGLRPEFAYYDFAIDQKFSRFNADQLFGGTLQGWSELKINIGDVLTMTPSLGVQLASRTSPATLEPRLRVTYRPGDTDRRELSLAVGKYNQVSEGLTDTQDAGSEFTVWTPEFAGEDSQRALHAILGYRQELSDQIEVSVEGYAKDITNIPVTEWNPVDRFETRLASADGRAYGVDTRVEVAADPLYLFAGYGWSKVTYQSATGDLGAWIDGRVFEYSPSHDRRHQVNLVAELDLSQFKASVGWEFGSGRPFTKAYGFDLAVDVIARLSPPTTTSGRSLVLYDEPYSGRLPSYHRLDISVTRTFELTSQVTLQPEVGTINAYDRKNVFYYDVSADNIVRQIPLYPYISMSVEFE